MTRRYLTAITLALAFLGSLSCSIYIPGDWDPWPATYRVVFDVTPEDASVFLNGKFIGLAYEFSTPSSALKLSSLNNELYLKKKGFREKALILSDLYQPGSRTLMITETLATSTAPVPVPDTTETDEIPLEYRGTTVPVEQKDEETPITPEAEVKKCQLSLTFSHAGAAIFLNGKFIGVSPEDKSITNLPVIRKIHHLAVFKPGFSVFQKTLDLKDRETHSVEILLHEE
jgi:hypothetical protein